jgi:hypothetical protein
MTISNSTFFENLPFHLAAYEGKLQNVETIAGENSTTTNQRGLTALHVAILSSHIACAKSLMIFQNNRMMDWTTRIASNDPAEWKAIIVKAIHAKKQQLSKN